VLALQGCLLGEDLTPLLPQIRVPTLILASPQDDITPLEVQQLMARQIPGATLQTFDGVGHNMKVEIPDLLAGRVLRFIGQAVDSRPG
jgi:pimeloyl-ACP methyl ester carboxylesterase